MDQLLVSIRQIISRSRESTARSINHALTVVYWQIGRVIVEEEQQGDKRADYGKALIKNLSAQLVADYGENLSSRNLQLSRQLYLAFSIMNAPNSQLSWTYYKALMRIDDPDKRAFYEAETVKNAWSVRQTERQINSLLYERLLLSQDKETLLAFARDESIPADSLRLIKDPTILAFLGLKPQPTYYEKDIEEAIITHLQKFILELGNGFSFVARQKRLVSKGMNSLLIWCSTTGCYNASCCSTLRSVRSRTKKWANSKCTSTTMTATYAKPSRTKLLGYYCARTKMMQ